MHILMFLCLMLASSGLSRFIFRSSFPSCIAFPPTSLRFPSWLPASVQGSFRVLIFTYQVTRNFNSHLLLKPVVAPAGGEGSVTLDTGLGAIITAWRQLKWVNALPWPSPRRQLAARLPSGRQ